MKRPLIAIFILIGLSAKAQHPYMRVYFVDSLLNNEISPTPLPQVAISGYYDNLLHIPSISINGISHSVTDGQTWTISTGTGTVTSITPGWGHTSSTPITTSGTITVDSTKVTTVASFNQRRPNQLSKTANYTIATTDFAAGQEPILHIWFDATSGNLTATLPSASNCPGCIIVIGKSDASTNIVTISGLSADNKIGTQLWAKELYSNSSSWVQN